MININGLGEKEKPETGEVSGKMSKMVYEIVTALGCFVSGVQIVNCF